MGGEGGKDDALLNETEIVGVREEEVGKMTSMRAMVLPSIPVFTTVQPEEETHDDEERLFFQPP